MFYAHSTIPASSFEDINAACDFADSSASYTQKNIIITSEENEVVYFRQWAGCLDGIGDQDDPIQIGNFGYYADWQNND